MWRVVIFTAAVLAVVSSDGCVSRKSRSYGENDGHYCVCNATYCDQTPTVTKSRLASVYNLITSSKSGLRFHVSQGIYGNVISPDRSIGKIVLNVSQQYQTIVGFGGAVTDSAGLNIRSLSSETADRLMQSYFGTNGLEYNLIRTPMGGSDFSTRPYAYAVKENDTLLQYFQLQAEDYLYKIPVIKKAINLSRRQVKVLTAPWSANPWMKTNNTWSYGGKLRREYWQVWANYFVKYFQEYKHHGIPFWGLTAQNEPVLYTYVNDTPINGMRWSPEEERDWIVDYLSPTLKSAGFSDIKIFVGDDNRQSIPEWPKVVMQNKKARNIVSGTAVHWYMDNVTSPFTLDETKRLFPEKLILYTEACLGVREAQNVILGSWLRGELYAKNIIENMSHWVSSWIDWNIALNVKGGPNWINNFVDSPIIVNAAADEFYKQPMYYVMGHFSKYVTPNSVRIGTKSSNLDGVQHIAFVTPNKATVLVLLNTNTESKDILIDDYRKGVTKVTLPGKSINTMKYW